MKWETPAKNPIVPGWYADPEARFYEDLDLDSIDAVDLVVRLRNEHNLDVGPDDFKSIRTVGDLIEVLERITEGAAK